MPIIDSHHHLWDLERFPYSWCQPIALLNRSFRLTDYQKASAGLGIERTVHVEADVDEPFMLQETLHILNLAEQPGNPLAGVVACGRPEARDFQKHLDQIAGHPQLKGVRRILYNQPDELSQSPLFRDNIRLLHDYRLTFDLCVLDRQLPIAIDLVNACPDVSFVLDHCGFPRIRERIVDPWREYIQTLAGLPNIVCKISGMVTRADHSSWSSEDLRPYVDHVIDSFGWERVLFGSDWPVCTLAGTLLQWMETLDALTRDAGAANRHRLLYANAARVYHLCDTS